MRGATPGIARPPRRPRVLRVELRSRVDGRALVAAIVVDGLNLVAILAQLAGHVWRADLQRHLAAQRRVVERGVAGERDVVDYDALALEHVETNHHGHLRGGVAGRSQPGR